MSDQQHASDRPLWLRIVYAVAGTILIILGIISGLIPIIPGFVLIIIGLTLLTRVNPRIGFWPRSQMQKIIGWIKKRRKKRVE